MTTAELITRLTDVARGLEFGSPRVVENDGVLSLRATVASGVYAPVERHVGYIGLPKEGVRRLTAELKKLAGES